MSSVNIEKFFKWGSYSGTKNVEQITTALGTIIDHTPDGEGIGFLVSGDNNEIVGITAKNAKVNFKSLGGGTLGTAAATEGTGSHGPQITLTKNTGTDAVNLATAQNSYLTITADNAGTVTYGYTKAVLASGNTSFGTAGLVESDDLTTYVTAKIAALKDLTIYAGPSDGTGVYAPTTIGTYDPDSSSTQGIYINIFGSETSGNTHATGLVPATTSSTSTTGYYLSGNGQWTALPIETAYTIGSSQPASNASTLSLYADAQATSPTVSFGVANSTASATEGGYGLVLTGSGANTINYGLNYDTLTALGHADASVYDIYLDQGMLMAKTHTATTFTNESTATTTHTISQSVIGTVFMDMADAGIVSNGIANFRTTHTIGTSQSPADLAATAAYNGTVASNNYNPLATKSYVDKTVAGSNATYALSSAAGTGTYTSTTIDLTKTLGSSDTNVGSVTFGVGDNLTLTATANNITVAHTDVETTNALSTATLAKITTDGKGHIVTTASATSSDITSLVSDGSAVVAVPGSYTPGTGETATYKVDIHGVSQSDLAIAQGTTDTTLYFKSAPDATNPIITEDDLSGIVGAMVYKGTATAGTYAGTAIAHSGSETTPETGYVYVAAGDITTSNDATLLGVAVPDGHYEAGDMFIYNGSSWNIVSGENQVINNAATLTAGDANLTTLATVDGTAITAKVAEAAGTLHTSNITCTDTTLTAVTSSTQTPTQTTVWSDGTNTLELAVKHYAPTSVGDDVTAPTTSTAPASQNYVCGITMDDDGHVTATSYANPFVWEEITIN